MKTCTCCGEDKPLAEFYRTVREHLETAAAHFAECRKCFSARMRRRYYERIGRVAA